MAKRVNATIEQAEARITTRGMDAVMTALGLLTAALLIVPF